MLFPYAYYQKRVHSNKQTSAILYSFLFYTTAMRLLLKNERSTPSIKNLKRHKPYETAEWPLGVPGGYVLVDEKIKLTLYLS